MVEITQNTRDVASLSVTLTFISLHHVIFSVLFCLSEFKYSTRVVCTYLVSCIAIYEVSGIQSLRVVYCGILWYTLEYPMRYLYFLSISDTQALRRVCVPRLYKRQVEYSVPLESGA